MWKTMMLKDVCTVFTDGDWIETKDQSASGIRLVQTGNVKVGAFADRKDKARYISEETFVRLKCTEVKEGDILVSRLPEPVGRACVIPSLEERAITAVDCTVIRPKEDVLPPYLNYYMQSPQYFRLVQDKVTGATRQRISRKNLGEILITLPPLAEQHRIVAKLDAACAEIDRAIERVNQQLHESEALYKTSLTRCFNDESVTRKPLSEICKITSSKRVMKKDYVDNGVPFFRTKEIKQLANGEPVTTELFISKEMFDSLRHKFGAPKEGEILITAIGTIGELYVVRENDEFYFKDGNVLWLKEISDVSQEYLRYGLLSFVEQLNSLAHGAAYSALPIQRLKAFELPIPPIPQQLEIVKRLEESFELIAKFKNFLSSKRNSLDILKSSILAQELRPSQSEAA